MSGLDDQRLRVVPGDGVVVRAPGVVAVAFPSDAAHTTLVNDLVAAVRSASGTPDAGRRATRAVAGLLAGAESAPPLGLVGADGDGVAVLLHGEVEFLQQGGERLAGTDAAAWLDRLVADLPAQWSLARAGSGAADEWSDLQSGVARGNGVAAGGDTALTPAAAGPPAAEPEPAASDAEPEPAAAGPEPAAAEAPLTPSGLPAPIPPTGPAAELVPPPPAAPAPQPSADFVAVSLLEPDDEPARAPLPVATADRPAPEAEAEADDEPAAPIVTGIRCSRDHLNDPQSAYCAVCGISMVQVTHAPVKGPRPPLGVLVLDDGSTYVVDRDIVIGREPEVDDDARRGAARAVALPDPERAISRVHAKVTLHEWEVRIVDAGSANGTFVAARDATQWTPVPGGQPVPLTPGMHVLVGQRVLSFDSHRRG